MRAGRLSLWEPTVAAVTSVIAMNLYPQFFFMLQTFLRDRERRRDRFLDLFQLTRRERSRSTSSSVLNIGYPETVANDVAPDAVAANTSAFGTNKNITTARSNHDTPLPLTPLSRPVPQSQSGSTSTEPTPADNTPEDIASHHAPLAVQGADVWSIAYREAIASFSKDEQGQIKHDENFKDLLQKLNKIDEANKSESSFQRGLDRLQGPLKTCKLVLDFAAPFLSMEPTAATAVGVVQGVTTVAIGICGAASELSDDIREMLDRIPYIDKCDFLSRSGDGDRDLHEGLVRVYKELLNFYLAALDILNSKYYLLKVVANHLQTRLPTIVEQFVYHAEKLNDHIQTKTLELVQGLTQMMLDRKVQELLGGTKEATLFHCSISDIRSDFACSWISQEPRFKEWYSSTTSENLLLYGRMGCGKTVTANYIIDEVIRLNNTQFPKPRTCYHYCKPDSSSSSVDILSSLILQVLSQKGDLAKKEFCDWYDERRRSQPIDPTQSFNELRALLEELADERPLYVILDGLDECTTDTLEMLVPFIRDFPKKTPVKFCLTARHSHDIIDILRESSFCIQMIEDSERDAAIVRHMVKLKLPQLDENLQSEIITQLTAQVGGSAIWIKVSIDLLRQHYDEIDNMEDLIDLLKREICYSELSQLYGKLFSRIATTSTKKYVLCTALEILAVAKRPLLSQELKWAIAFERDRKKVLSEIDKSVEKAPVKSVLSWLRPFISLIDDEDPAKSYVRLAHESIRELVLESSPSSWGYLNMEGKPARRSELEAKLLALCVEYLMLDEIDQKDLFNTEQRDTQIFWDALPIGCADSDDNASDHTDSDDTVPMYYDPVVQGFGGLFAYSSCFWIEHLRHTPVESFPTISTIIALTSANSRRLSNWYQQSCRPDCTLLSKWTERIHRLDPLIFISLHGPIHMLQELLGRPISESYFARNSVKIAIEEIIRWGDISRLKYFVEGPQRDNLRSLVCHHLMLHWEERKGLGQKDDQKWDECFDLVLPSSEELIEQESGNELLCVAVRFRCFPIIKKLFEAADSNVALRNELLCSQLRDSRQNQNSSPYEHQSVGIAVRNSDLEILRYLLSQAGIEDHLNHVDTRGSGVLHIAAKMGCLEVFKLLVPLLKAQVNRITELGDTALDVLVFGNPTPGQIECAKVLLIEGEADVSSGRREGGATLDWFHPLRAAVRAGSIEMCRVLIEVGHADPCVAFKVDDEEASLLDPGNFNETTDREKVRRDILAMLCSFAGVKFP
ncbi:hypothetical protein F4678DRAFT_464345 [Xylaria arbuscula]|nr:hypothetical protein F4678DRAFT_464345 [Xylaria arbuscula]